MVMTAFVSRFATVVRFTFFEETSAGTSQEHKNAKQLFHSILKLEGRQFDYWSDRANGLPRQARAGRKKVDRRPM